jgi:hypothetical protein
MSEKVDTLIQRIVAEINQAESSQNTYSFIEARRLLINDLRQAVRELEQPCVEKPSKASSKSI